MEKFDSLKPGNQVKITIFAPDGSSLYQSTDTGYHSIEEAINIALDKANLEINPQDCVFEVTNETTDVSHRYRFNAHDHLKLII